MIRIFLIIGIEGVFGTGWVKEEFCPLPPNLGRLCLSFFDQLLFRQAPSPCNRLFRLHHCQLYYCYRLGVGLGVGLGLDTVTITIVHN